MEKNQKRVGVKPSAKVLKKYCAQRFGYCRRRGFLARKFNRRTRVEPCTNAQSKPFSPAFGNTLLAAVFLFFKPFNYLCNNFIFIQISSKNYVRCNSVTINFLILVCHKASRQKQNCSIIKIKCSIRCS